MEKPSNNQQIGRWLSQLFLGVVDCFLLLGDVLIFVEIFQVFHQLFSSFCEVCPQHLLFFQLLLVVVRFFLSVCQFFQLLLLGVFLVLLFLLVFARLFLSYSSFCCQAVPQLCSVCQFFVRLSLSFLVFYFPQIRSVAFQWRRNSFSQVSLLLEVFCRYFLGFSQVFPSCSYVFLLG